MFKILKRYLGEFIIEIIVNVCVVILQIVLQTIFLMREMQKIIDQGVNNADMDYIIKSGSKMLLFTVLIISCSFIVSYVSARIAGSVTCSVRKDCFEKVLGMSSQDFNRFGQSTLLTRTATDAMQLQVLLVNFLRTSLMVPVVVVCMLALIFKMNRLLFLILFVLFTGTTIYLVAGGMSVKKIFEKLQKKVDRINLLTKEKITGVRTIRAFNNEDLETGKLEQVNHEAHDMSIYANKKLNFLSPVSLVLMNWAVVLIYFAGSVQLKYQMASVSDLLLIFQYLGYFISCLAIVPVLVNMIPKVSVVCSRINELLDYEEINGQNTAEEKSGGKTSGISKGEVVFQNVTFGYNGAVDVLKDINFTAKSGKTTAFIGTTGSGKTTLFNLLLRLYKPTDGKILIDGTDIREYDPEYLRKSVSYATQQAMVFQDSAYNNITAYHDIPKEKVKEACDAAMFTEVLDKMSDGMDTVMSLGGMNISGGQRQRMSLARTLVKDAEVYLFDDSFSALDAKTESIVRKNVKKLLDGKTVLMVAQKISTVMDADQIIVLDNGRIVGQGTHEELMASCSEYQEIYQTQCYAKE